MSLTSEAEEKYHKAVYDFIKGNGTGAPDPELCRILMNYNSSIRNQIDKALENRSVSSLGIFAYDGTSLMFANNPIYTSNNTTKISVKKNSKEMCVYFDRN